MTSRIVSSRDRFRLSQLIYDSRYRSYTIQAFAFLIFLAFIGWLVNNTLQNLGNAGKDLDFSFLGHTAGYKINQTLIAYGPESTYLRAAVVGLLNTLLVAVLGCASATIIGTLVGILRLSRNWLIATLTTVYVEVFRNVPLLLWLLLTMAVLTEILPPPSAFRGDDATAAMLLFGTSAITNRGIYIPMPQFAGGFEDITVFGGALNINVNMLAVLAVLAGGFYAAHRIKRWADRVQNATGARPATWYWRFLVIAVPLLLLFYAFSLYFDYPALKGFNFKGGLRLRNSLIALWVALTLYTAAFIAEIVRGGILAISEGQSEAAAALGLSPAKTMRLVILPQALRVIIPPAISQYLSLTKNTSLAIAVGYMDITGTLGGITMNQTGRELESVLLLMLVYLTISLLISLAMNFYNARVKLVER
jgi:general L-amino acid transport system permease protein